MPCRLSYFGRSDEIQRKFTSHVNGHIEPFVESSDEPQGVGANGHYVYPPPARSWRHEIEGKKETSRVGQCSRRRLSAG